MVDYKRGKPFAEHSMSLTVQTAELYSGNSGA